MVAVWPDTTERQRVEVALARTTAEFWRVWECAPWTEQHAGRCDCADCAPVWQRADALAIECGRLSRLLETLP